ncbi:hypothetical protein UA36_15230 [Photobacterium angustum]|nr:hypothetical protein UA39_14230 [Photobacterium angustum]KJG29505.1 hypothetical protein UA36_15230 [Photobacterium angustum]
MFIIKAVRAYLYMYYVTAKNIFLSGWGRAGKFDCYVCIMCKTRHEASIVAVNARHRSDLQRVKIHSKVPLSLTEDTLKVGRHILTAYIVKVLDKTTEPKLFMPNYFQYRSKPKILKR